MTKEKINTTLKKEQNYSIIEKIITIEKATKPPKKTQEQKKIVQNYGKKKKSGNKYRKNEQKPRKKIKKSVS